MEINKLLYIVHCVDTEGPLNESVSATFERLKKVLGINNIEPTKENLIKIQNGEIKLGKKETAVADICNPFLLDYKRNWDQIDEMLDRIMSVGFRNKYLDSDGKGWIYNWHCVDHVMYDKNPRRRDMGYHHIFDHYRNRVNSQDICQDAIHWHFHPMSFSRSAHHSGTSYFNSPQLYEILTRRVIDRKWFPSVNRAGYHTERPDSHWFLEQWIPFDYSNQAMSEVRDHGGNVNRINGRFGDWRLAPSDWSVYNPSYDNYQIPGKCKRFIARCLNMSGSHELLSQKEVDNAFRRASSNIPTIMSFTNHDFREMSKEIEAVRCMIKRAAEKFPDVRFFYSEAVDAMRKTVLSNKSRIIDPLKLSLDLDKLHDNVYLLNVRIIDGDLFGTQPFLAIKTTANKYYSDNFNIKKHGSEWFYVFDENTFELSEVDSIGVAANDIMGNQFIDIISVNID